MICRNASPTSRSEPVKPRRSAFVESASSRSTPGCRSRRACRHRSGSVHRRVIELPVARMEDPPASVSITRPTLSGTECAMRTNSTADGPSSIGGPSGSISRNSAARRSPCSSSFDLTSPSVRRVAQTSAPPLAEQIGQRTDVVLVRVGQYNGPHLARPLAQVRESGRTRSTPDARRAETQGRHRPRGAVLVLETVMFFPTSRARERDHP